MYNSVHIKPFKDVHENETVCNEIISILKKHKSSLSNTKYIFDAIINEIEDNNPITL